jgi:S-formylglutathione hydrolase FrmB
MVRPRHCIKILPVTRPILSGNGDNHAAFHLGRQRPSRAAEPSGELSPVYKVLNSENVALRARLTQLGSAATFDFDGPGSHDGPYWQPELHRAWPPHQHIGLSGASCGLLPSAARFPSRDWRPASS